MVISTAYNRPEKSGGNPNARQMAATILHTITQQNNLTDIWRDRNRDIPKFTWTRKNPHDNTYIHTRIDKFYISSTLSTYITKTEIIPFSFSDHDLVSLTFDLNNQPPRESYWLSNNNLLEDDVFNANINNFWINWLAKKNEFATPLLWWDTAKHHFKIIAIKQSSQLRKQEPHEHKQMECKIQELQQRLADGNQTISEKYLEAKTELKQYYLQETATCAFQTKVQYTEEGKKSARYFYSLE